MDFMWDESKSVANLKKHGLSFEDARNVFNDPMAITRMDWHDHEPRWQILGHWGPILLILVVYTMRTEQDSDVIRLISARRASTAERRQYEKGQWL